MVALNSEIISFFCPSQHYLFYYWASDFLAGNLSDVNGLYLKGTDLKHTNFHRNTGKYIVTGPIDNSANLFVGYKTSSNEIRITYLSGLYFYPERLAFDQAIFLVIGRFFGIVDPLWVTGVFTSEGVIKEYYRYEFMPNAIEMTETAENQTVRLFVTGKIEDEFILFREIVDIDFSNSTIVYVSIEANCGSVIRANDQIVVVSCSDYRNVPLSVYTTDLVHLKTIEGLPINKF
jgi:hypothetical protein